MEFLCLEFMNSRWDKGGDASSADPLENAQWMRRFCRKWSLPYPVVDSPDSLVRLREFLCRAGRDFCVGQTLSPGDMQDLNAYLQASLFVKCLEKRGKGISLALVPQGAPNGSVAFAIVLSFAELIGSPEPERVKCCDNPDCGWIFYDESKNRTRKWCDNTCASLIKVRRFRAAKGARAAALGGGSS